MQQVMLFNYILQFSKEFQDSKTISLHKIVFLNQYKKLASTNQQEPNYNSINNEFVSQCRCPNSRWGLFCQKKNTKGKKKVIRANSNALFTQENQDFLIGTMGRWCITYQGQAKWAQITLDRIDPQD